MKISKVASRYAAALYEFAEETQNVECVYPNILLIDDTLSANQELKTVLESPIIPQNKKQKIFQEVFQNRLCETTLRFFTIILKKRREPELLFICKEFVTIYYRKHNIKEVYITTAHPLSDKMKEYLKNYIEKDSPYTFILHCLVEPNMVGGLIVKVDDLYFDASIQTKINKLKAEFSQNDYAVGF